MNDSTIRLSPHATFWVLAFALILFAFLLLSDILLPFVLGLALAYLFHPFVNRMARIGFSRGLAAFIVLALVTLAIAAIFSLILPPILDQLGQLIQDLPSYIDKARVFIDQTFESFLRRIGQSRSGASATNVQQEIAQHFAPWLVAQAQGLLQGGISFFNSVALLFLTPVITFFLLRDWDRMIAGVEELLPRQDAPAITAIGREINRTIAGYLRGTLIVLLIVSAFYMAALEIVGLNYGLVIGLGAGMFSFVPYLGSTSGFLVSGGVAAAQFWPDYTKIAIVCGIFVFGQVIEGNVLTPNIVGNQVRLHPVWLLFALIASGYLLGFTGLLISVPLAAAIGVVVRHAVRHYYGSAMYHAEADPREGQ